MNDYLGLVLKCGEINLKAMELLDAGNTGTCGHPVPTKVPLGHKKGQAILVSGHDLKDLEEVLKQSAGKGVYVYTHGEMLPCHAYPEIKQKYPHFHGHYGTAWQNQAKEFGQFPGAIVMTTNCIQKPTDAYRDNIFTSGLVGWPGVRHTRYGIEVSRCVLKFQLYPPDRRRALANQHNPNLCRQCIDLNNLLRYGLIFMRFGFDELNVKIYVYRRIAI